MSYKCPEVLPTGKKCNQVLKKSGTFAGQLVCSSCHLYWTRADDDTLIPWDKSAYMINKKRKKKVVLCEVCQKPMSVPHSPSICEERLKYLAKSIKYKK